MIIYGKQVCLHALEQHSEKIKTVYVAKKGILPKELFHKYHNSIKFLEEKWAQSMSKGGNHQGILVEMEAFEQSTLTEIKKNDFIVVLDGLTDVGNIGAIVRSAYALGADAVISAGVKQLNFAAIARTSSGAMLDMPFMISANILDTFNELQQLGFTFYGASMDGENVQEMTFDTKRVLVLGSEGKGLSKKVIAKLDHRVSIEMKHAFDSLNVSAAAAILIHRMGYAIK
ncbi:23S rRNA (guanosine(2251)-2'-O)-methyltransferase RlmB [Sulfurovum sp. XTW-4]|uniref:23S rRNA (Guanosine(2251)-2'-O)-methyltransferase RlmB n=1 Tax=Sulfurovum xiamenensis TaxID=3019066 RepID=A0ABT7QRW9_9BACT|nr:23S rRNA (guanosine(2251)-2'-O)-methyltransferase RlmB [Sulfurovum xiamenensis]MDM5263823.1 23S rRNA (guanosine(2251)-2'-O)-methyltransferase RlmB [Sulfurovum xiamenensis]